MTHAILAILARLLSPLPVPPHPIDGQIEVEFL